MARNTNINEILFPVECRPVFLKNQQRPVKGFRAVTGILDDASESVFAIVSDNYQLISNQEAFDMGIEIHNRLFPNASSASFEVFNVIAPKTKGSCHIDVIDKNYTLNIFAKEVYVPFVRIQNSYNRTLPLKFQIGFCRKLCNNGMIYEEDLVSISMAHTKQLYRNTDFMSLNVEHLKKFETDFMLKTTMSTKLDLPRKYFIPLAAKVLKRKFDWDEKNEKKRKLNEQRRKEFVSTIGSYTEHYIHKEQMGETAYAFFNVITDYASNVKHLQARSTNDMQSKCGLWLNQIGAKSVEPTFSWDNVVKEYIDFMN